MKTIRSLLAAVTLFAAIFVATAVQAQTPIYTGNNFALSNYVVAIGQTSNSIGAVISCGKQSNLAIQWQVASPTFAENTNIVMRLSGSVDGSVYDTNRWVLTADPTTAPLNVLLTNLDVRGFGFVRIDSITATGIAATNKVKYGVKISAP